MFEGVVEATTCWVFLTSWVESHNVQINSDRVARKEFFGQMLRQ